jgi:hypothetical protein
MNDGMQQRDGAEVSLQCGHPGVEPGQVCNLCGQRTEGPEQSQESSTEKDVSLEEKLTQE